ncbi:hypothetical protein [Novosphingobium marinum]|uniref:hypothetical protein n=1 Tax=Novosphingobium marinum TaxID=1514948 RepID=UPI0016655272|nr:hypothetical protein [Novosphingobium marinum]
MKSVVGFIGERLVIILLPGIIAGICGFLIGFETGFKISTILALVSAATLIAVPGGVLFTELPIGLFLGGLIGIFRNR